MRRLMDTRCGEVQGVDEEWIDMRVADVRRRPAHRDAFAGEHLEISREGLEGQYPHGKDVIRAAPEPATLSWVVARPES